MFFFELSDLNYYNYLVYQIKYKEIPIQRDGQFYKVY